MQAQVKQTTQAINRLHNLLARVFPELATLTDDIAAGWVLRLLDKYPTAERIAEAHLARWRRFPISPASKAEAMHQAAGQSVATLRGDVAEALVRSLVTQVRHSQKAEKDLRQLLTAAFDDLPASGHLQVVTIPGIGPATAAVLVAKIVDIERFETPEQLVSYFGIFPEEDSSGVDKQGRPLPPGTLHMCHKGNDLVRGYLWNAARSAIRHNPAVRALYRRLEAKGKRGDVAMGHCMRKLLHLVFAVWKTDRPFDGEHFPWENPGDASRGDDDHPAIPAPVPHPMATTKAVGHKRDVPAERSGHHGQLHRRARTRSLSSQRHRRPRPRGPRWTTHYLRQQVTMEQVLQHLGLLANCAAAASSAVVPARCTATPEPRSEPSPSIWGRTPFSASTRIVRSRGTSWISGRRSIVCRCTKPRCTWPRPSTCPGTEKRNP